MQELIAYSDVTASKGSEYLVLLVFFVVLIGFWKFLNTSAEK